jgi:alkylmercury lyase
MTTSTLDHLTQRLLDWYETQSQVAEIEALTPVLLTELARGEPVDAARIAAQAGMPASGVLGLLRGSPAEWDPDGRLVGLGLTLRATRHRFEVDGRVLYTWCAPDTLAFPAVLGSEAHVQSPWFATREPIHVDVGPEGIRSVEPTQAVVSIVTRAANRSDFRRALCHEQHLFSSRQAASQWQSAHPEGIVVSVGDAFTLTRADCSRAGSNQHTGLETPRPRRPRKCRRSKQV